MSSNTTNLALTKLTGSENFSNTVLNANWDKIDGTLGVTQLFSGTLLSGQDATLSETIEHFVFVLLVFKTNAEIKTQLIPTAIARTANISETLMGASASGQTTYPLSYNSSTIVQFTSATKVQCNQLVYNNQNYLCKLTNVYGVMRKSS